MKILTSHIIEYSQKANLYLMSKNTARSRRYGTVVPKRIPNSEITVCLVSETIFSHPVNLTKHTVISEFRNSIRKTPVP